jgi:hypothetical protein
MNRKYLILSKKGKSRANLVSTQWAKASTAGMLGANTFYTSYKLYF